jgi:hypothetical protein
VTDLDVVAELAKKSGLLWIRHDDRTFPVWHEWIADEESGGAVYVVGDGAEQPLPAVVDGGVVTLLLRAKSDRHLVASVDATVERITPDDDRWPAVTDTLKAGRLNLADSDGAVERWARESRVLRLVPRDPVTRAGEMATDRERTYPRLT